MCSHNLEGNQETFLKSILELPVMQLVPEQGCGAKLQLLLKRLGH